MYSTTSTTLSRELTHAFCPGIPGRPGGPGGPCTICPESLTRSSRRPWAECGQQTEKCWIMQPWPQGFKSKTSSCCGVMCLISPSPTFDVISYFAGHIGVVVSTQTPWSGAGHSWLSLVSWGSRRARWTWQSKHSSSWVVIWRWWQYKMITEDYLIWQRLWLFRHGRDRSEVKRHNTEEFSRIFSHLPQWIDNNDISGTKWYNSPRWFVSLLYYHCCYSVDISWYF